ncbi:MAG: DUF480 domain-containing protein [Ignavibacteria bacterium CG_4_9_14_3_um_filter_36_18]|nr:DUF480 domain-containing protein [Ignavibacteria bacterium]PJB01783.1 MAG: DUF480 domain-containing protein [Ignavibacteria bacterium CG_4_9_14_3_um_filter_36_18]
MDFRLNDIEVRVIGSLIEKEKTTPEYYPLSLNSLKNACNQKSNRNPVITCEESEIEKAIEKLREKKFAVRRTGDDLRVPKFRQTFTETLNLTDKETAVLAVLMLRGAQTPGEIKGRTGRLYDFSSLEEVDEVLTALSIREEPYIKKLSRLPGTKENRFVHLFSGESDLKSNKKGSEKDNELAAPDEIEKLHEEINLLNSELVKLRCEFEEFRKRFE